MIFADRREAGSLLAAKLAALKGEPAVVLGIPRGGVVVAFEVARALRVPLDVIVPRKIGSPANPELAVGAVAEDGTVVLDANLAALVGAHPAYVDREAAHQVAEIKRRTGLYRGTAPPADLEGNTVIVVDDGIATGYTVRAALRSLRSSHPARAILAVPVAPPETVAELKRECDQVVCLTTPEPFYAVGQFYQVFNQVEDEEVIDLIRRARQGYVP